MTIGIDEVHLSLAGMEGVSPRAAWGETAYFYNPGAVCARGTYFATLKEKDGENDRGSKLGRAGVWRLGFGVRRPTFEALFGPPPPRPGKGRTIAGPWQFEALDRLMPHPVYGWMCWVAVLCPEPATFEACRPLLADAHLRARETFLRRRKA